jgi:hypothetical protein
MDGPDKNGPQKLKPSTGDWVHLGAKALIPVATTVAGGVFGPAGAAIGGLIGGPIAEFFGAIFAAPLSKREAHWLTSFYEDFEILQDKVGNLTIEDLQQNEVFVSTFLHASQVAMRTHQGEKLEALRNAVLNSTLPDAPDDDMQLMFVNLIDTMTPWHLRLLTYFINPREYGEKRGIHYPSLSTRGRDISTQDGPRAVLEHTFQELVARPDFYQQVVRELYIRGLTSTDPLDKSLDPDGLDFYGHEFDSITTDFGTQFLAFITSPLESDT